MTNTSQEIAKKTNNQNKQRTLIFCLAFVHGKTTDLANPHIKLIKAFPHPLFGATCWSHVCLVQDLRNEVYGLKLTESQLQDQLGAEAVHVAELGRVG